MQQSGCYKRTEESTTLDSQWLSQSLPSYNSCNAAWKDNHIPLLECPSNWEFSQQPNNLSVSYHNPGRSLNLKLRHHYTFTINFTWKTAFPENKGLSSQNKGFKGFWLTACFISEKYHDSVVDPGLPARGVNLIGGCLLPRQLHFKNFVCQNERIWTQGGGMCVCQACLLHLPNVISVISDINQIVCPKLSHKMCILLSLLQSLALE